MAFRDDREALKQRAAELEAELASAEKERDAERANAQRAKQLEAELVAARQRLHAFERNLPRRRSASPFIFVGVGVAVMVLLGVGAGVFMFAARSASRPPPPPVVVQQPVVGPGQQPAAQPAQPREVTARWRGRVKTATGSVKLAAGTACEVEAVLRTPQGSELRLSCGDAVLYRSTDALSGMSQFSMNVGETPGPSPGTALLWLAWDDIGARTGARSQVSINTQQRVAAAWKETEPSFRVEVEVEVMSEPASGTLEPGHTEAALAFTERARATGKVTKVSGKAPIAAGASCELTLAPAWGGANCRATLLCDGKRLYGDGTNGFSTCTVDGTKATVFTDDVDDGDPIFRWDLQKGTAKLVVNGAEEWEADITATIQP